MSMNPADPWLPVVQAFVQAYAQGERLTSQTVCPTADGTAARAVPSKKGPTILLCSPHPDDESLTGTLPLRLRREMGATVVNLAITLGSNPARQAARREELHAACTVLGFSCQLLAVPAAFVLKAGPGGQGWETVVQTLVELIGDLAPDLIFFPHADDHHPAHCATNQLLTAALTLASRQQAQPLRAVETEYWRPMARPNLLVGVSPGDVARLIAAVACHQGEIERNPYHLTLPARLLDSVRRGAEVVASNQAGRPPFLFGELYRLSQWHQGGNRELDVAPGWLAPGQGLHGLLGERERGRRG
jgi:LmbE family N-acetylglucosaminyl deacetylase